MKKTKLTRTAKTIRRANTFALNINGCKLTLNFMPESNGAAIDTAKRCWYLRNIRAIPHEDKAEEIC